MARSLVVTSPKPKAGMMPSSSKGSSVSPRIRITCQNKANCTDSVLCSVISIISTHIFYKSVGRTDHTISSRLFFVSQNLVSKGDGEFLPTKLSRQLNSFLLRCVNPIFFVTVKKMEFCELRPIPPSARHVKLQPPFGRWRLYLVIRIGPIGIIKWVKAPSTKCHLSLCVVAGRKVYPCTLKLIKHFLFPGIVTVRSTSENIFFHGKSSDCRDTVVCFCCPRKRCVFFSCSFFFVFGATCASLSPCWRIFSSRVKHQGIYLLAGKDCSIHVEFHEDFSHQRFFRPDKDYLLWNPHLEYKGIFSDTFQSGF